MAIVRTLKSFKAPPHNIDLIVNGRQVFYRSNMEFVEGVLAVNNGGTGNTKFKDGNVLIYTDGKLVSTDVTQDELNALSGLTVETPAGEPIGVMDLLAEKVSTITDSNGTPLDMDENNAVKLPDYLLKTGGTISGNLAVEGEFKVGELKIAWNDVTKCVSFSIV